jgi:hypothetical protein
MYKLDMNKILILGLLAILGCSQTQESNQTSTNTDSKVTQNTSQVTVTEVPTPVLIPTPTPTPTLTPRLQPTAPAILQTIPTLQPLPPLTQNTPQTVVPEVGKKIASSQKLAANIRASIGCGIVNEEYRTKVAAMAIALTNPKATEQLTEPQFYQAVRQSVAENQAKANNLVAEFRAKNCGAQSKNVNTNTQKVPTPTDKVILEQSGSCKDLSARGISNINVKANPWARELDQDKDGTACESN